MSIENQPCPRREQLLQRLLNDETPGALTPADQAHLGECPSCARAVRAAQKMEGMLAGHFGEIKASVQPVPPGPALETEMNPPTSWWPLLTNIFVVLMFVLGFLSKYPGSKLATPVIPTPPAKSLEKPPVPVPTPPPSQLMLASGRLVRSDGAVLMAAQWIPENGEVLSCPENALITVNEVFIALSQSETKIHPEKLALSKGRAEIAIKKKGRAFQVVTPSTTVSAQGTIFAVALEPDGSTFVGVQQGIVRVETIAGMKQSLNAGGELRVDAKGLAKVSTPIANPAPEPASATATPSQPQPASETISSPEPATVASPLPPTENWQFLVDAAARGQLEIVRRALGNGAAVNVRDEEGNTPLHQAARNGHKNVVEALLAAGADRTLENKWKQTPLALATAQGNDEVVPLLK